MRTKEEYLKTLPNKNRNLYLNGEKIGEAGRTNVSPSDTVDVIAQALFVVVAQRDLAQLVSHVRVDDRREHDEVRVPPAA